MSDELVLIDREALQAELQQVFDARTAEVLLRMLDKVVAQIRQADVTREDFRKLTQIVTDLAEAQRRTTEEMKELAAAQRRTEEQVGRLEAVVEETNRAVGRLAGAIDELRKQVSGLSETVGGDIEDIAYIVLHNVLKREFGWQVGVLERSWQIWDEEPEEVNIFGVATDPARPEKTIWIVGEAKHNLTVNEVRKFMRQVERARQHLIGEEISL